jgi:uncharacterized protein (TIGR00369 family)
MRRDSTRTFWLLQPRGDGNGSGAASGFPLTAVLRMHEIVATIIVITRENGKAPLPDTDAVLARWQADEVAVRARLAAPGVAAPELITGLSGMQFFEAIFAGRLPSPAIGRTLDFLPIAIESGRAVFQGRPKLEHYNPLGTVHGGWIATLLDSCVGCAVHSALPAGKAYTTAELKVNFVRPVTTRVALLRAEGRVIHGGSRMATADGRLIGPDGKLYAHASTTCFIFDAS